MPDRIENIEMMNNTVRRLRTIYDRRAALHGLTLARIRVLLRLDAEEGLTQVELAQKLQIEAPTLKRQVDDLVATGFIERRPVEGGGRARALYLTDFAKGHSVSEFHRHVRHTLLEEVTDDELAVFNAVLVKIRRNLDKLEAE